MVIVFEYKKYFFMTLFSCCILFSISSQVQYNALAAVKLIVSTSQNEITTPGKVSIDFNMDGKVSTEEIIQQIIEKSQIDINDVWSWIERSQVIPSDTFKSKLLLSTWDIKDSLITHDTLEKSKKIIGQYGEELSRKGIHPLKSKSIFFLPDGSGTYLSNPRDISFYPSGKIKEISVGNNKSFFIIVPDGKTIEVRGVMFHKNGGVFFVNADGLNLELNYQGKKVGAVFANWDLDGELCAISKKNGEQIDITLSSGIIIHDPIWFSYSTQFPSKHNGEFVRCKYPTFIWLKNGDMTGITLPNGQVLKGSVHTMRFYDTGELLEIRLTGKSDPIHWNQPKDLPVVNSPQWVYKEFREPAPSAAKNGRVFMEDTLLIIEGGAQFSIDGQLIAYWQEQVGE
jgi:hypothetical protein